MSKHENLPFPIGTTYFDGQTADTTTETAINLEGKEYEVEDLNYVPATFSATKTLRTGRYKRVRIVRNVSGVALIAGNLAQASNAGTDGRYLLGRAIGYTNVPPNATLNTPPVFGIDEFLPSAGCPNNDLFYATIQGPFLGFSSPLTADFQGGTTQIVVGDWLVAATGAATTNTTNIATAGAGKLASQTFNAATTGISQLFNLNAVQNRIGRALSALTSAQTTVALLIAMTRLKEFVV